MNIRTIAAGRRRRIATRIHGYQRSQRPPWTCGTPQYAGLRPEPVGSTSGHLAAAALHLAGPAVYAPTWVPMIRIVVLWVLAVVIIILVRGGAPIEVPDLVSVVHDRLATTHF